MIISKLHKFRFSFKIAFLYVLATSVVRLECEAAAVPGSELSCLYKQHDPDCTGADCRSSVELCNKLDTGRPTYCYSSWRNNSGKIEVMNQGCWFASGEDCLAGPECVATEMIPRNNIHFCCCLGNMCNTEFSYNPVPRTTQEPTTPVPAPVKKPNVALLVVTALAPLVAVTVVVVLGFYMYKRHKVAYEEALPNSDTLTIPLLDELLGNLLKPGHVNRDIRLLEVKARGRFGKVWKAQLNANELLAVKVFPPQDRISFQAECDLYTLPGISEHPNILHFIGIEQHEEDYWLLTEFHHKGSLHDYLKSHQPSLADTMRLIESMLSGLAFLHTDVPGGKPSVAHRDFKSKNVLVRADMTACLADFGLAMKFEPGKRIGDSHGQVGTRRYMAPEVLEGAISFNRDSFLRIDMYACGLVMWEMMSRCNISQDCLDVYRLPYEEQLGLGTPVLHDIQELVVTQKERPLLLDGWKQTKEMKLLACTIQECWDHDPEARLTAECAHERMAGLILDPHDPHEYPSDPETSSTTSSGAMVECSTDKDSGQDTLRSNDIHLQACPNVCITQGKPLTPDLARKNGLIYPQTQIIMSPTSPKSSTVHSFSTSDYSSSSSSGHSQSVDTEI